jgi:hypothetical protein
MPMRLLLNVQKAQPRHGGGRILQLGGVEVPRACSEGPCYHCLLVTSVCLRYVLQLIACLGMLTFLLPFLFIHRLWPRYLNTNYVLWYDWW